MIRVHPEVSDLLRRGDVHGVRAALQAAVEVEHAVIPPYRMLPRYPGPLPGSVDDGLVVGLAPFSVPLVRDVFMRIEQPEQALGSWPAGTAAADGGPELRVAARPRLS